MVHQKAERMDMPQVIKLSACFLIYFSMKIHAYPILGTIDTYSLIYNDRERRIQIFNPFNVIINPNTTFFIMSDGEELFDKKSSWNGKSWNIDKKIMASNSKLQEKDFIIIAVDSAKRGKSIIDETRRYIEFFPEEVIDEFDDGFRKFAYRRIKNLGGNDYKSFIVQYLIPFLEKKYNQKLNKNNMGTIGASMGAIAALNLIIEYPDLFGSVGAISTHWVGIKPIEYATLPLRKSFKGDRATFDAIKNYIERNVNNLKGKRVYFDYGTLGLDKNYNKPQSEINNLLDINKIEYKTLKFNNHGHEAKFFGERIVEVMSYLNNY